MSNSLQDSVADLWLVIAMRRVAKGSYDDVEAGIRANRTAENLRYTQKLREGGWDDFGVTAYPPEPLGRGWHDAHMPAKLGA